MGEWVIIWATETILAAIAALQIKHVLADYFLQSTYMVQNKGRYGHPGGLMHAGMHAAFSFGVLIALGVTPGIAALICAIEFLVHYHIDWGKENIGKILSVGPDNVKFWFVHGTDQAAHQLTYVAMVYWLSKGTW